MIEWLKLKEISRQGWVLKGVESPESVAAHSWSMAILALTLCPQHLDLHKVLSMCLIHDLGEIVIGDLTPHDDLTHKSEREREGFKSIAEMYLPLFDEYEKGETEESNFVKKMDKLDMALQSRRYEEIGDVDLSEFRASADQYLHSTSFQSLYN